MGEDLVGKVMGQLGASETKPLVMGKFGISSGKQELALTSFC